jgi:octaprenyl-diphosphate synthase
LFAACLRLGALLGQKSDAIEMRLGSYGANLGLAFQLVDDLLDFTSSEERLGKPVGNDLREGKMTLPLIYLLRRCRPEEQQKVSQVLEDGGFRRASLAEIQELIERYGALEAAQTKAREFGGIARQALQEFPGSPYKEALHALADFTVERQY